MTKETTAKLRARFDCLQAQHAALEDRLAKNSDLDHHEVVIIKKRKLHIKDELASLALRLTPRKVAGSAQPAAPTQVSDTPIRSSRGISFG